MKLIYICNEAPFPANHGGRVDVWRRLCAMHAAGVEIVLVFWAGDHAAEQPTLNDQKVLLQFCRDIHWYPIKRTWRARLMRLSRLSTYPSHVASRIIDEDTCQSLLSKLENFQADAVWLESIYGGVLAKQLSDHFKIPYFVRSHNIEHLYMERQVAKATNLRDRLAWSLNLPHLKKFERAILRNARQYFDISSDDLRFWQSEGLNNGQCLPPMIDAQFGFLLQNEHDFNPQYDVGYLGNLYSPNNVDGVLWFLRQVVPLLKQQKQDVRIFIAGSKPTEIIRSAICDTGVDLIDSPPDVIPVLRNAKVLVNPIFAGSGVNIKSVEMLFTPAHLVSSFQGVAGLPEEVKIHFDIQNDAAKFARSILNYLAQSPSVDQPSRELARANFSSNRAVKLTADLYNMIGEK